MRNTKSAERKRFEFGQLATMKVANDPAKAGQLATRKITFGELSRYAIAAVHTRFDAVQWFVWDVNSGEPVVIRQAATFAIALVGLVSPASL